MRRIHRELHSRAPDFDHHKVGPLGGMLLLTIGERESVDIQTVVDMLGRDKSQISRLIQRFEKMGLLVREKSAEDSRVSIVTLTATGRDQLEKIQNALTLVVDSLFSSLPSKEQTVFADTIESVLNIDEG